MADPLNLTDEESFRLLTRLADIEGFADPALMSYAYINLAVVPGICISDGCEFTKHVGIFVSDERCPNCGNKTVASFLTIAGWV